jgi:hypothetical protein
MDPVVEAGMDVSWTAPDGQPGWLSVPVGAWSITGGVQSERAAVGVWTDGVRAIAALVEAWPDGETGRRVARALVGDWIGVMATRRWRPLPSAIDVHDALSAAHAMAQQRALAQPAERASFGERALRWLGRADPGSVRFASLLLRVDADDARGFAVTLGDVPLFVGDAQTSRPLLDATVRARLATGSFTAARGASGEAYVGSPVALAGLLAATTSDTPQVWTATLRAPDREGWVTTGRGAFVAAAPLSGGAAGLRTAMEPPDTTLPTLSDDASGGGPGGPAGPKPTRPDDAPPPPLEARPRPPATYLADAASALAEARSAPRRPRRGNLTRWADAVPDEEDGAGG